MKRISKLNSFKLNTYIIAGPENIQDKTLLPKETKREGLIRFVYTFASLGLDVFQLRCKNLKDKEFLSLAQDLGFILKNTNCKFCVNDNVKVVSMLPNEIDILHIGQDDMKPEQAKNQINNKVKIGWSITDISQVEKIPYFVDYIGVGPIYPTTTKNDAANAMGEEVIERIIKTVKIPVVAIGGIKLKNINRLRSLGVSGIAIISEIFNSNNPKDKFIEFKNLAK